MNKINLTELVDEPEHGYYITEEEYKELYVIKENGWTECKTEKEWLAKLYYLRTGFKQNKIKKEDFNRIEENLIVNWCKKNLAKSITSQAANEK